MADSSGAQLLPFGSRHVLDQAMGLSETGPASLVPVFEDSDVDTLHVRSGVYVSKPGIPSSVGQRLDREVEADTEVLMEGERGLTMGREFVGHDLVSDGRAPAYTRHLVRRAPWKVWRARIEPRDLVDELDLEFLGATP